VFVSELPTASADSIDRAAVKAAHGGA